MQKQYLASFIGVLFSSAAFAAGSPFSGFYASAGLGWENLQVREELLVENIALGIFDLSHSYSPILTDNSITGGIGLGYSKIIKQIFLGGLEVRANFENPEASFNTRFTEDPFSLGVSSKTSAKLNNDFALLLKLGLIMYPNTLIYGLLGPTWGNFKVSSNANFFIGEEGGSVNKKESGYETGWLAGLGIEYLMTQNLSLAFEYTHADYGTFDSIDLFEPVVVGGTEVGSLSMSNELNAKTDNVSLRLTYYFDKSEIKKVMKN